MSYTVKYRELQMLTAGAAFGKLTSNTRLSVTHLLGVARMKKALSEHVTVLDDCRKAILEKHCDRDDEGKPIMDNPQTYKFDENWSEVDAELSELLDNEIEVDGDKIQLPITDIDECMLGFNADDILVLEPFIDFIEGENAQG